MVVRRMERRGEAFVAENASLTGDVTLGSGSSVWFGCVLRGDDAPIVVGERTNLQDLTMVHADPGVPLTIGDLVTVGHRAVLHGRRIGSRCLIGMGAILLAGSVIGEGSIVGAGALVPEGREIPPGSLAVGVPARVVRRVTGEELRIGILEAAEGYVAKAREHVAGRYL